MIYKDKKLKFANTYYQLTKKYVNQKSYNISKPNLDYLIRRIKQRKNKTNLFIGIGKFIFNKPIVKVFSIESLSWFTAKLAMITWIFIFVLVSANTSLSTNLIILLGSLPLTLPILFSNPIGSFFHRDKFKNHSVIELEDILPNIVSNNFNKKIDVSKITKLLTKENKTKKELDYLNYIKNNYEYVYTQCKYDSVSDSEYLLDDLAKYLNISDKEKRVNVLKINNIVTNHLKHLSIFKDKETVCDTFTDMCNNYSENYKKYLYYIPEDLEKSYSYYQDLTKEKYHNNTLYNLITEINEAKDKKIPYNHFDLDSIINWNVIWHFFKYKEDLTFLDVLEKHKDTLKFLQKTYITADSFKTDKEFSYLINSKEVLINLEEALVHLVDDLNKAIDLAILNTNLDKAKDTSVSLDIGDENLPDTSELEAYSNMIKIQNKVYNHSKL